jgi:hypothetical protein
MYAQHTNGETGQQAAASAAAAALRRASPLRKVRAREVDVEGDEVGLLVQVIERQPPK